MKILVWKGYHEEGLRELIAGAWRGDYLLILCPPLLRETDFVRFLPEGEIVPVGDWDEEMRRALLRADKRRRDGSEFPAKPVLGVFTTGTVSGSPRLILYSKRNIEASLLDILGVFDRQRIRKVFCYPQPFHTFGLNLGYVLSLLLDVPLLSGAGRYGHGFHEQWLEAVNGAEGSDLLTLGAPAHFADLIGFVRDKGLRPPVSYSAIVGGAKASVALWTAMREQLQIEAPSIGYGATEASPGLTHLPPGHAPREDGEIGFPLVKDIEVVPGKGVRFAGPNLCMAVVQNGELVFPQSMLIRDDIECREDGVWLYRGRTDLVLNRGGAKLSLERIEEILLKRVGVEAVCVPVPDERLGEELAIMVRGSEAGVGAASALDQAATVPWESIYRELKSSFGLSFNTRYGVRVDEFPLNGSLKLDRKAVSKILCRDLGISK